MASRRHRFWRSGLGTAALSSASRFDLPPSITYFSPLDISGCAAYYNAQVIASLWQDSSRSTPVASNGDPIGAWDDLTGNGNHAIQATTSAKPTYAAAGINSLGALSFDGGDYLQCASYSGGFLSQPYTVVGVWIQSNPNAEVDALADMGVKLVGTNAGTSKLRMYAGADLYGANNSADTSLHLHIALFNGASSVYYVDGSSSATGNPSTGTWNGTSIGARNSGSRLLPSGSYMAAAIVYSGDIGSTARGQLLSWAQSTFGTP